ncbi:ADP-heptose:LPS heptosyltransferase [Desulfonauticus submarinus]|uniref:ADP-heptose:LPS heptosyltransferase n=1 Tax=Desulfonauticus submarinus TaxID=206665 RepID=A0A1H0F712_9BACT|nr:glycosyltransferase family 9 protein [Desulfonauticus submarinus]SDN90477.1 ADP-heptose:LPS heptosyltransferase [Desulfonauticus submarinus]
MAANFLVIQLARLGDILQTKRLLLSLLSQGNVVLLVDKSLAEFASKIFPQVEVMSIIAHGGELSEKNLIIENKKSFARLKTYNFEKVYNLNFSPLNFVCAKLFSGEKVIGYTHENRQNLKSVWTKKGFLWTRKRKLSPLNLVDFWAYLCPCPHPAQSVNPEAKLNSGPIGVVVSGRNQRRSLGLEKLAFLISYFIDKGQECYLLGSWQEKKVAKNLMKVLAPKYREKVVDLTGQTSLLDLIEIVKNLSFLITPDTGIMHLACHFGVKTLSFFLSSAWCFETGPYGKGHEVVQVCLDCSPCIENRECFFDLKCHQILNEKVLYFLAEKKKSPSAHVLVGESFFDEIGVDYFLEVEPDFLKERQKLRLSLKEYLLGIDLGIRYPEFLFSDREWILDWRRAYDCR